MNLKVFQLTDNNKNYEQVEGKWQKLVHNCREANKGKSQLVNLPREETNGWLA